MLRSVSTIAVRALPRPLVPLIVLVPTLIAAPVAVAEVQATSERFTSGGASVTAEWFRTSDAGGERRPAMLLLHGADGLSRFPELYRVAARVLAGNGYHVFLLHYFDRTGTRAPVVDRATVYRHFAVWSMTLGDAITWLQSHPAVSADRIGAMGFSLGASLALARATWDARLRAVVDYFGALPEPVAAGATRMAPTLILHGELDPIVPVERAYALERFLTDRNVPYDIKIYPGQGHGFTGLVPADAGTRTIRFLNRYLNGTWP